MTTANWSQKFVPDTATRIHSLTLPFTLIQLTKKSKAEASEGTSLMFSIEITVIHA